MPGELYCFVDDCNNEQRKMKSEGTSLRFFAFPREIELRQKWIQQCTIEKTFCAAKSKVCSIHFAPDQFEDEIRAKLMKTMPKRLKKDAIPSLHLPLQDIKTEFIKQEIVSNSIKSISLPSEVRIKLENPSNPTTKYQIENDALKAENAILRKRITDLELMVDELKRRKTD